MDEQLSAARAGLAGLAVLPIGYKKELVHDDKIALALLFFGK
ncbi:hypothetical protein AALG83_08855 [Christensenellaceae bacterium 44-20]